MSLATTYFNFIGRTIVINKKGMMSISTRRIKNIGLGKSRRSRYPTTTEEREEEVSHSSHSILGNIISVSTSSSDTTSSKNDALPLLQKLATTATMHGKKRELDEAWECCTTMKQILQQHAQTLPMKKMLAETYYRMAMIYETQEELDEALAHYLDSWKLFKQCKEQDALAQLEGDMVHSNLWMVKCLVQISELLVAVGHYDEALDVADRAIKEMVKIPQDIHGKELSEMKEKVLSNFNTILNNGDSET